VPTAVFSRKKQFSLFFILRRKTMKFKSISSDLLVTILTLVGAFFAVTVAMAFPDESNFYSYSAPYPYPYPPINDDFNNAKIVAPIPYTDILDVSGATVAHDDPTLSCISNTGRRTVWYRFTPASSGWVRIETWGSNYDTVLGLYTGSRGNLTQVACNDDIFVNLTSALHLHLTAGTTYYINVAEYPSMSGLEGQGNYENPANQPEKDGLPSELDGQSGKTLKLTVKTDFFDHRSMWINDFNLNAGWRMADHPRMMADVNGDGRADIIGFGSSGVWVSLSTGNDFAPRTMWLNDFNLNAGWRMADHPRMMADVNGDGRADIVGFGSSGVWVSLSTGSSFLPRTMWIDDFNLNAGWRMADHPRMMADVNGDGRADIVGFGSSGVWVSLSTGNSFLPPVPAYDLEQ
jgi:uncharacterized protein YbdZ (MbtH family)